MKMILLSNGGETLVDDDDYERLSTHKWYARTIRGDTYVCMANGKEKGRAMHVFILGRKNGMVIDHQNRNRFDNQKLNLRFATGSQNGSNSKFRKNNTSGFKGVSFDKDANRFKASIAIKRKKISLGRFSDALDAALAYDAAAIRLFGEFACTNAMLGLLPHAPNPATCEKSPAPCGIAPTGADAV